MVMGSHPSARVRSLRSDYNCMGLVFASRRTSIDPDDLYMILSDDGFLKIGESECDVGDLVVYRGDDNEVSHVGIIARIETQLATAERLIFGLSQWGKDGEYVHEIRDVNPLLGTPTEFWTDRYGLALRS